MVFCGLGVYATSGAIFDLLMLLGLAVVGFLMRRHGVPLAPLMIGMVLGPLAETSMRDALLGSNGDYSVFVSGPIPVAIYAALLVVLLLVLRSAVTKRTRKDM